MGKAAAAPSRRSAAPGAHPPALDIAHVASLLDMAADAILTLSPEERITSWNRGAQEMLGWSADEVIGRDFSFLLPEHERAQGELEWIHRTTLAKGSIKDHETRRVRKDGTVLDVSLTRTAVRSATGSLIGFTAILRDISDRKRLERHVLTSERLATTGRVAAGVAHEIGAPLTAIAMTIEHMFRQRCMTCAGAEQMRILQSQTDRIARLARQLVDLAKPAGLTYSPVSLSEVAAAASQLVRPQFELRGGRVHVEIAAGTPTVVGDAAQLQQVLLNLLFNALRAVPEGRGEVRISSRHRDPGTVEILVEDNGSGIAADDLPHLFTPFFSRAGGAGLGLALAAQIVQAHHGTIEAESQPGLGARFTITLPVAHGHR